METPRPSAAGGSLSRLGVGGGLRQRRCAGALRRRRDNGFFLGVLQLPQHTGECSAPSGAVFPGGEHGARACEVVGHGGPCQARPSAHPGDAPGARLDPHSLRCAEGVPAPALLGRASCLQGGVAIARSRTNRSLGAVSSRSPRVRSGPHIRHAVVLAGHEARYQRNSGDQRWAGGFVPRRTDARRRAPPRLGIV